MGLFSRAKAIFTNSYDAIDGRGRRYKKAINLNAEDEILKPRDRDKLVSDSRNLRRNAPDVGWMLRKHLDYVATYEFQCRNPFGDFPEDVKTKVAEDIERLMRWWARPFNCDASGRHDFFGMIRLIESAATIDGDVFVYKLEDGTLQLFEADQIRTPTELGEKFKDSGIDLTKYVHGVQCDDQGKPLFYALTERGPYGGYVLKAIMPAYTVFQYGHFERYNQVRGISRLASAVNTFCDIYESREYTLAKMKLHALFGLKFKRAAGTGVAEDAIGYDFDFGGGPQAIDLDPGDDAEFMESKTPSTEFQSFLQTGTAVGLKALDIPYSFFDEAHTNYSGARQALVMYEQSASNKRAKLQLLLNQLTIWRLRMFIQAGELVLPEGMRLDNLDFEWIPAAIPWIDPLKEANAWEKQINIKLASRQQLAKEQGKDWFTIVDQLAEEEAYMKKIGLQVDAPAEAPATPTPEEVAQQIQDEIDNAGGPVQK